MSRQQLDIGEGGQFFQAMRAREIVNDSVIHIRQSNDAASHGNSIEVFVTGIEEPI